MATEKLLIDANAIEYPEYFYTGEKNPDPFIEGFHQGKIDAINDIRALAPTVDAVEVVHAEWIDIRFDPMWRSMLTTCSHCKIRGEVRVKSNECGFAVPDSNYCPNCGAKMDGDGNG